MRHNSSSVIGLEIPVDKASNILHSIEPMDANDWLRTIDKKLQVVQCTNRERVLFAEHQLVGPAVDWWDAYVEAYEEPETHQLAAIQEQLQDSSCAVWNDEAQEERI
jgi:hypothetical protein